MAEIGKQKGKCIHLVVPYLIYHENHRRFLTPIFVSVDWESFEAGDGDRIELLSENMC